jgi:hypothetical protein
MHLITAVCTPSTEKRAIMEKANLVLKDLKSYSDSARE